MKKLLLAFTVLSFFSCKDDVTVPEIINEDAATFQEISSVNIGGAGAAEISAYDPATKKLFVVNNSSINQIDVLDVQNPATPSKIHVINLSAYGGFVNSLDVYGGKLAAAIEATNKQDNGKVVIFSTDNYVEIKAVTVGALPDMVTYTPDGKYILTANEGEPSADYTNDPEGTVSIINTQNNYAVSTINFASFAAQEATLKQKGLRVFGNNAGFAKDMEPEYIAVSADAKTAWVTLQENNAIAKINITSATVENIFPLGFKNYAVAGNEVDVSDADGGINFAGWPVKGMYQPDAIAVYETNGIPHLFTANEGDARDYTALKEDKRVKSIVLDATKFPDAGIKADAKLGRLNITTKLGDTDGDGDFDELYSFGARSFSIWNGTNGEQLYDSKNDLDQRAKTANVYDDARSDDKSVEAESITIGKVGTKTVAFVGLERADAVVVYDITNVLSPVFLQIIKTGDAPEGLLFIPATKSHTKRSMLIVSSESDGNVKIYQPNKL